MKSYLLTIGLKPDQVEYVIQNGFDACLVWDIMRSLL
jgi:hypothetical protein